MTEPLQPAGAEAPPAPPGGRALVHIGLNKSGSTTIQTWLARNREALRGQGVAYEESVRVPVLVRFDEKPSAVLRPGMSASVTVVTGGS